MTNASDFAKAWHPRLFTIGHSNHEWEAFVNLLHQTGVTAVADVRTHPSSQRLPQFNGPELENALQREDIEYVFLGDSLGGRPKSKALYHAEGHVDYERMRATRYFQQGLERLRRGTDQHTVVLMCSEEDPLDCHRGLMITPALMEQGIAPGHVRRDGNIESTWEMEQRLLEGTKMKEMLDGLFAEM